jgi:hypothetical protein
MVSFPRSYHELKERWNLSRFKKARQEVFENGMKDDCFLPFEEKGKKYAFSKFVSYRGWSFELDVYESGEYYFVVYNGMLFTKGFIEFNDLSKTCDKDFSLAHYAYLLRLSYASNDENLYENVLKYHSLDIVKSIIPLAADSFIGKTKQFLGKMMKKAN